MLATVSLLLFLGGCRPLDRRAASFPEDAAMPMEGDGAVRAAPPPAREWSSRDAGQAASPDTSRDSGVAESHAHVRDAGLGNASITAASELTLQLSGGLIQGKVEGKTRSFLGIPYARPPVGPLRFMPPEPALPWIGTRLALAYGPSCLQPAEGVKEAQSED